jgi:phosphoenolpyruvate carboxykinase (ATP)
MQDNNPHAKIQEMADIVKNPDNRILQQLVSDMPKATLTEWGNFSVRTKMTARSNQYTYVVSDEDCSRPNICRSDYEAVVKIQDAYSQSHDMVEIQGTIALEEPVCAPSSLLVETSAANVAAMQAQLYFSSNPNVEPLIKVIYTPTLIPDILGIPTLIAVDFENYTTRILGTDYFGESKKAGLRMWNKWVYDLGGLALHAGCKTYFDHKGEEKSIIIIGLSGTGKTTTTFNCHLGSLPVQDDFCALFPDGRLFASENGCFAKTFGLDQAHEPNIYNALKDPDAWLENVAVDENGKVDYLNGSYTTNGRGTFTLDKIEHRDPKILPEVSHIIILNRNFDIIPGIALLKQEQAVEYYMLGETTGTSAGGVAEAGKFLRVPGTNPFFFGNDALQGKRFSDILKQNPKIQVALMNTGCIGGYTEDPCAVKVKISHSSAILEALLKDEIPWQNDEDFGYMIPSQPIPGVPIEITNPRSLYLSVGKQLEYQKTSENLKISRSEYFDSMSK